MKIEAKRKENSKSLQAKVPFGKNPTRLYNKKRKKANLSHLNRGKKAKKGMRFEEFCRFLKENDIDIQKFVLLIDSCKSID